MTDNCKEVYNPNINRTIINYDEMTDALINAIPNNKEKPYILDLGSGTGCLAEKILKRFPKAHITCIDISQVMIKTAKNNLKKYDNVDFIQGDFTNINVCNKYDAIITAITLNYLTRKSKETLSEKIYKALKNEGVFYNADLIKANSQYNERLNRKEFYNYLKQKDILIETSIKTDIKETNTTLSLIEYMEILEKTGFKQIDLIWKHYSNGVYGGTKIER